MKAVDVKDNAYINFKKEVNDKDPKFKVGDHVRISKNKNIFAEGYTPNWSKEAFVVSKVKKNQFHGHMNKRCQRRRWSCLYSVLIFIFCL